MTNNFQVLIFNVYLIFDDFPEARFSHQRSTDALIGEEFLVKVEQLTIPLKHCPSDKKITLRNKLL